MTITRSIAFYLMRVQNSELIIAVRNSWQPEIYSNMALKFIGKIRNNISSFCPD